MKNFKQVTRRDPCPICDGKNWCAVSHDGRAVMCMRIASADGAITRTNSRGEDYGLYFSGSGPRPDPVRYQPDSEPDAAPVETRDRVYVALLEHLGLSHAHREGLRARGLTDEEIDARGYRTMPAPNDRGQVLRQIVAAFPDEDLSLVPGFYRVGKALRLGGDPGTVVPVRDAAGLIVALKIRRDTVAEGEPRYRWLSSSSHDGPSPGSPAHVPLFEGDRTLARVTEGELKADLCAALTGVFTIGIPGATCSRSALVALHAAGATRVLLAWDSDKAKRPASGRTNWVASGLEHAAHIFREAGLEISVEHWPAAAGKGLDDVLAAHMGEAVQVYEGPAAWRVIAATIRRSGGKPRPETLALAGTDPSDPSGDDAPPVAPTTRGFVRGDHVEIAARLVRELRGELSVDPVFDRGQFRVYDEDRGIFVQLDDAELSRRVQRYAGEPVGGSTEKPGKPLKLAAGDIRGVIRVAADQLAAPGFFNAAPSGVAFRNGFVTVESGRVTLQPHSPEFRATHALPFDYNERATAPRWERFLREVWTHPAEASAPPAVRAGFQHDRSLRVQFLEEWAGAALLGEITRHAMCLILLGEDGSNGKSVLLHVLRALFPPTSVRSIAPHLWANVFHLAELSGCRLNVVNELPDGDIVAGEVFKAVVSGDAVNAARKNRDPFDLEPEGGHLFACNSLPGTRDQSGGFWRRWGLLTFERKFSGTERDLTLRHTLARDELPGIAVRVLAAAARLQTRGEFVLPPSSEDAKETWQFETDQVWQFVAAEFAGLARIGGGRVGAARLYEAFVEWSRKNGHGGMTSTKFGRRVSKLLDRGEDNNGRFYCAQTPSPSQPSIPSTNPPPLNARNQTTVEGMEGLEGSQTHTCARETQGTHERDAREPRARIASYQPSKPSIPSTIQQNQQVTGGGLVEGCDQPSTVPDLLDSTGDDPIDDEQGDAWEPEGPLEGALDGATP